MKKENKFNLYQTVTNKIIEGLKEGKLFWRKSWSGGLLPQNFITKKPYRGLNRLLLSMSDKKCPYYLTFNQITSLKGSVNKGAKSELITYWGSFEKESKETDKEGNEQTETVFYLKYYRVFNLEDTKGINWQDELNKHIVKRNDAEKIIECENILENYEQMPEVKHHENRACYYSDFDYINMPEKELFFSDEEYYSTLFHELVHSTGHNKRLNRLKVGKENYAKEELIAEIGNAFLCAETGIEQITLENSTAYIKNWLGALKSDEKYIIFAAAQAQKAVDYILSTKKSSKESEAKTCAIV